MTRGECHPRGLSEPGVAVKVAPFGRVLGPGTVVEAQHPQNYA